MLQGNALIGQHLFRRLRHHQLTLVCPAPAGEIAHYQAELAQLFDAVHLVPRAKPVAALVGSFEPSLAKPGIRQAGSADPAAARALSRCVGQLLRQQSFDVIHTRQLPMAAITGGIDHPAKLLELIDSEALQAARRVRRAQNQAARNRGAMIEQRAVRMFQACTTVADADAQMICSLAPRCR